MRKETNNKLKTDSTMKKVFVTRKFNKNASEITREEFVAMMRADVESTIAKFRTWSAIVNDKKYQEDNEAYKIRRAEKIEGIIEKSYKLYKREFYRLRYVEREIASIPEELDRCYYRGKELGGITWDIKPWSNGCTLIMWGSNLWGINEYDAEYLERYVSGLYDEAIKNEYFLQSTGWSIVEHLSSAEFKLHLSDEMEAKWKEDEHKLAESIAHFYEGCTYWGD
jgi:hypothetical protein